jgi:capsule polysaccharide export protein KpsE/RkpR
MTELQLPDALANEIKHEAETEGVTVATLLEAALRERRQRLQRAKLSAEQATWRALAPEARSRYAGQYVAIHEGEVVDHDTDLAALHRRVRARYGKLAVLLTPAEGRPPLHTRSPKLMQS